jgi:hypothetical protein
MDAAASPAGIRAGLAHCAQAGPPAAPTARTAPDAAVIPASSAGHPALPIGSLT